MDEYTPAENAGLSGVEDFHHVYFAQEVIFGPGALARLSEAVDRLGRQRIMLCTSRSMQANGRANQVADLLGDRLVAVFAEVQPHVQDSQVDAVLELAEKTGADAVIGMGGGSPIGMAKASAFGLDAKRSGRSTRASPFSLPLVPVIAIPTTYAGSEMTAVFGITHSRDNPPRKVTVSDPRAVPKLVIYDPELTLDLNPEMTASTGMNALAHCIEALYSPTRHPLSTAAALSGIRHIFKALLCCYRHGDDVNARAEMMLGAHLAGYSLSGVKMGLHHGLCHVLGGTANIPHGIANSIILPHAVRFNAEATAAQLLPAAEAAGISSNDHSPVQMVLDLADKIFRLTGKMNLPQRLRDVGVREADLPVLAQMGYQNQTVQNNPRPVISASQVEALLRAAW